MGGVLLEDLQINYLLTSIKCDLRSQGSWLDLKKHNALMMQALEWTYLIIPLT